MLILQGGSSARQHQTMVGWGKQAIL